jgi:hypothetical protein
VMISAVRRSVPAPRRGSSVNGDVSRPIIE